ncbi:CheR family methyltransferase [Paludibaculum fermentans]|uniref:protein-glutamate O-methyltransferase n=1 Tax=Paludibaculum fermentans TaxID=1473598 RepID=A0A7S7SI53_PALFE|nr:protein-glutamate O-methyltransferase CheR [Paludibaculum fermentans]QOY85071.1 protein-glutamate O-methyltransferase CheR [Paludibaculum fermentans]
MATLTSALGSIDPGNYNFLQDVVYRGSGIVLDHEKHYLFESRLSPVARARGLQSINDLCSLIRATGGDEVRKQVIEAMTTNETYFFREPGQYDAITRVLLPEVKELRHATRKLNCWSAASSTGQEAYSLALLLMEEGFGGWNVQILGTDLTSHVVEKARQGKYLQIEVNRGLPVSLLLKYFRRVALDWQLNDQIRSMVRFESFDLRNSMRSLGPFDLVFCRNVLVYFDIETRRTILRQMHGTMFRGGWLLLGTAEAPIGLDDLYERRMVGSAVVYIAR